MIRDRNLTVAKLVPLTTKEGSGKELALAASGELLLPSHKLNERAFWSIGADIPVTRDVVEAAARAVSEDREERDAGFWDVSALVPICVPAQKTG